MSNLYTFLYLFAAVLFIVGLKGLTHPRTAVKGNLLAALGMLAATIIMVFEIREAHTDATHWTIILAGIVVGGGIGWWRAVTVEMTAMPEMVALFNGFGGAASLLVGALSMSPIAASASKFAEAAANAEKLGVTLDSPTQLHVAAFAIGASVLIGAITLTGSLVAYGKLQGLKWIPDKGIGGPPANMALVGLCVALTLWLTISPASGWILFLLVPLALIAGVALVVPIGGADMPVVISLLNSYSGIAAAATGFVIGNPLLIIAGSLVGASGVILTQIMCKAMNRSLSNVLFGGLGTDASGAMDKSQHAAFYDGKTKSTSADELALMLDGVRRVVIVPGYGMAVAQAQHAVRDLCNLLESKGTEVEFAIHPVAGRMPGHMNVLLAEADIPYDKLKEMDEINPTFAQTDVAIVIGANDVVNPVARTDPKSPIWGMPILDVDKARTVIIIKRSLSPGFAGIPNPLFIADNALMFYEDAKKAVLDTVTALKEG